MTKAPWNDSDGIAHWVDASVGDEVERGIDWDTWLTGQGDTLGVVTWTVPAGLTSLSEWESVNDVYIKLSCPTAGDYEINCKITTTDGARTQTKNKRIYLKVV